MDDGALIPFALSVELGELVDVDDVPRGRACGCVCPACRTPLVARKGDVRQAHFAHAARGVYKTTEDACDFSVFVAARLMLKQLIGSSLEMAVPAYLDCAVGDPRLDEVEWFTITEASRLDLDDVAVEQCFSGVLVDVQGRVRGHRFVVYITYPGRAVPEELKHPEDPGCGVLQLSLDGIGAVFAREHRTKSYCSILIDVLTGDWKGKHWVYHPLQERERAAAEERLRARIAVRRSSNASSTSGSVVGTDAAAERAIFKCVLCGAEWGGERRLGMSDCRSCAGRLCARPM